MFQTPEKSIIIVHDKNTVKAAEFLSGLIGALATQTDKAIPINAIVVNAKAFAAHPPEQKNAKQKIIYIGDFKEANVMADIIDKWLFEQFGIRFGWHGNRAVIAFTKELTDDEFCQMAEFASKEVKEYEMNMEQQVEKKGFNPFKHMKKSPLGKKFAAGWGGLVGLPILGKAFLGIGAVLAAKFVIASVAVGAVGAIAAMAVNKDKLDPVQITEQQHKFAVLYFYLKHLTDFVGIKDENDPQGEKDNKTQSNQEG